MENAILVPEGEQTERIWTQRDLGRILPHGWQVAQSGCHYTPIQGSEVALPPCRSMKHAIEQIRLFLAVVISTASQDLAQSYAEQQDMFADEVKYAA